MRFMIIDTCEIIDFISGGKSINHSHLYNKIIIITITIKSKNQEVGYTGPLVQKAISLIQD